MTCFKVDNNELQLPSGEPQASTHIYIYTYIYMIYVRVLAISCNIQQYSNRRCRVSWICQVNSPWKRCWVRGALDKSGVDGASQLTGDRGLDG